MTDYCSSDDDSGQTIALRESYNCFASLSQVKSGWLARNLLSLAALLSSSSPYCNAQLDCDFGTLSMAKSVAVDDISSYSGSHCSQCYIVS